MTGDSGQSCRLGGVTLGFLGLAAVTGVALVPLYRADAARASVEAIQAGLPLGWWLRSAHAVSAWGLLVATLAHLVDVLRAPDAVRVPPAAWWKAVLLLPAVVLALLGGFVLRGDADAVAALEVWRGVVGSIPAVGGVLADLALGPRGSGPAVAALHHAGTFTIACWILAADHARRVLPDGRSFVAAGLVTFALAGLVPVPLGPAPGAGSGDVLGPWYLLGLQGMLLDLPVQAGWIVPGAIVAAAGLSNAASRRVRTAAITSLIGLSAAWIGWTVRVLVAR